MNKSVIRIKNNKFHILAFLISALTILLIYVTTGIWPFGERMVLAMDLWGQYFPMLSNISSAVWKDGLLWSWKGGLGFNYIAQSAYYTNSPLFFVFALIPKNIGIYLINYLILFKFGLSSLTFSFLLKYKYNKNDFTTAAFSTAYALCAYTVAFISQTMWFDAVILLPIIVIGFEKLMVSRKPYVYCIALFLTALSNFYIAYAVCIFVFFYFAVFQVSYAKKRNILIRQSISFFGFSALSVGTAAFFIIPAFSAIGKTIASTLKYEGTLKMYHSGFDFVSRLMPGTSASLEYGVPNIYCSVLAVLCAIIFIFNPAVKIRKRIAYLLLIIFMLLSFNLNILNYIWHGLHYPNQLPGRQSFMFCFVIILMAYEAIINIKQINTRRIIICALILFGVLFSVLVSSYKIPLERVLITEVLILINSILLIMIKKDKRVVLASVSLCVLIIVEVAANSAFMTSKMPFISNLTDYKVRQKSITAFAKEYSGKENEFYRIETMPNFTFNPGQIGGYNGISYYSSTMQGTGYNFFKAMGFSVYAKNVSTIYKQTPITNMMFGIKYIYDAENKNNSYGLYKIMRSDEKTIYRNDYCLPIAYVCSDKLLDYNINKYSEPLLAQNEFIKSAAGITSDIFKRIDLHTEEAENAVVTSYSDGTKSFYKTDQGIDTLFNYKYTVESATDLFIQSDFKNGKISISINGNNVYNNDFKFSDINYIGKVLKDDEVDITIKNDKSSGTCGFDLYSFDAEVFYSAYRKLDESPMSVSSIDNIKVKGTINVKEDGILFTSIPNDGGWTLKIDGIKSEVLSVGDYLCAFSIEQGEHVLEFSYFPDGLLLGLSISIFCVLILTSAFIIIKRKGTIYQKHIDNVHEYAE